MRSLRPFLFTFSILSIALIVGFGVSKTFASQIGTGTVVGSGGLSSAINWNDSFVSSSASGTINGILVTARILPTLTMTVSGSGVIALGNISSAATASGSVSIEIGTNAANGASVTARSTNGGLDNTITPTIEISSLTVDGFADSYKYVSTLGTADSTAPGFTSSATLNTEVNNNTTNHTLYTSNKPQPITGVNDFTFTISALPNAQTPAGDYTDKVVLTVTGNF